LKLRTRDNSKQATWNLKIEKQDFLITYKIR
jgi:hypothetical protein